MGSRLSREHPNRNFCLTGQPTSPPVLIDHSHFEISIVQWKGNFLRLHSIEVHISQLRYSILYDEYSIICDYSVRQSHYQIKGGTPTCRRTTMLDSGQAASHHETTSLPGRRDVLDRSFDRHRSPPVFHRLVFHTRHNTHESPFLQLMGCEVKTRRPRSSLYPIRQVGQKITSIQKLPSKSTQNYLKLSKII